MNQITPRARPRRVRFFVNAASESLWKSDQALTRAAALGSPLAIESLYQRHRNRVYALCLRMTRNPAEAEDLTHDVFIHLLKKISSFRGDSQFTTWLHRLTTNLVLMHFRHKAIQTTQSLNDTDAKTFLTKTRYYNASHSLVDKIALEAALAQLSPGSRSVLQLFDIEGYSHVEIARRLGCSVGTSKSQLHRGRNRVKRFLSTVVTVEPVANHG